MGTRVADGMFVANMEAARRATGGGDEEAAAVLLISVEAAKCVAGSRG